MPKIQIELNDAYWTEMSNYKCFDMLNQRSVDVVSKIVGHLTHDSLRHSCHRIQKLKKMRVIWTLEISFWIMLRNYIEKKKIEKVELIKTMTISISSAISHKKFLLLQKYSIYTSTYCRMDHLMTFNSWFYRNFANVKHMEKKNFLLLLKRVLFSREHNLHMKRRKVSKAIYTDVNSVAWNLNADVNYWLKEKPKQIKKKPTGSLEWVQSDNISFSVVFGSFFFINSF